MLSDDLPTDIRAALAADGRAAAAFAALPPSHRREYLTWIAEAKQPSTRNRRVEGMIERLTTPTNGRDG